MSALNFSAFFAAVHGHPPLPWQARLAEQLIDGDRWPDLIDLPTASGKTACLDIAIFHLAHCAARGESWRAARRIVFMVDRRIIVDAAFQRAEKIRTALLKADDSAVRAVADALKKTAGGDTPLYCQKLRGGMPREPGFALNPAQPLVLTSTIDQVGSRLLFRGYGLSPYAWPLHAGLLGHDTLLLLDEAHLSTPFVETVNAIRGEQARAQRPLTPVQPLRLVRLSATAGDAGDAFQLDAADYANPLLGKRRNAPKPAQLLAAGGKPADRLKALTQQALAVYDALPPRSAVAVIVNRVRTARAVFEQLQKARKGDDIALQLMIGRSRPLARDAVANAVLARAGSGHNLDAPDRQGLIVVATQSIEVGADLDFQGLVTECAALDALRQRFGRLDRLGDFGSARAVIVGGDDRDDDPVYGAALNKTWAWLNANAESGAIDFGIAALQPKLAAADLLTLSAPRRETLLLTPSDVGLLAQTSPTPPVEPDVAKLLHGLGGDEPELQIVWRADLPTTPDDNGRLAPDGNETDLATEILDALPPSSLEALSLSLRSVRAWLAGGRGSDDLADIEGAAFGDDDPAKGPMPHVWRRHDDEWQAVSVRALRGGETIVVPVEYGGCDPYGYAPDSAEPVEDLAALARHNLQRAETQIETPASLLKKYSAKPAQAPDGVSARHRLEESAVENSWRALQQTFAEGALTGAELASQLLDQLALEPAALGWPEPYLATPLQRKNGTLYGLLVRSAAAAEGDFSDEDDRSASQTRDVSLEAHGAGVGTWAAAFSTAVGLPAESIALLRCAGLAHDVGKADPRFQRLLRGAFPAADETLLAKGKPGVRVVKAEPSERHEAYSVALLDSQPDWLAAVADPELMRYLVGSHHGRGRPYMPDPDDDGAVIACTLGGRSLRYEGAPQLGVVGSDWPVLFWRLVARYGPWGLAYLEALLRLSDHIQSRNELGSRPR